MCLLNPCFMVDSTETTASVLACQTSQSQVEWFFELRQSDVFYRHSWKNHRPEHGQVKRALLGSLAYSNKDYKLKYNTAISQYIFMKFSVISALISSTCFLLFLLLEEIRPRHWKYTVWSHLDIHKFLM